MHFDEDLLHRFRVTEKRIGKALREVERVDELLKKPMTDEKRFNLEMHKEKAMMNCVKLTITAKRINSMLMEDYPEGGYRAVNAEYLCKYMLSRLQ